MYSLSAAAVIPRGASCSGVSEGYIIEAFQYNSLNQLTEFDTSSQYNGYPYGVANPLQTPANSFFQRYYFSPTKNNGQITQTDDARVGCPAGDILYTLDRTHPYTF